MKNLTLLIIWIFDAFILYLHQTLILKYLNRIVKHYVWLYNACIKKFSYKEDKKMNIWGFDTQETLLELDELAAMDRDGRVKFAYDTAFVLEQDKEAIEEKFDVEFIHSEQVIYDRAIESLTIPFEFDLFHMFKFKLEEEVIDEYPNLFYVDFPKWLEWMESFIYDELLWCNENEQLCQKNFEKFLDYYRI